MIMSIKLDTKGFVSMSKKVYISIEILKIIILNWFLRMVYDVSVSSNHQNIDISVIGYTFLVMLATLVISSIILDILISIFTPKEKHRNGEWEKLINHNILRNFSYMLSVFFISFMIALAVHASFEQIVFALQAGFFMLVATIHLSKAYYYMG